jgi:uncharacterized spore protein YtfJ
MAKEITSTNQADGENMVPQTLELMNSTMKTFLSAASVDAVYAKPVKAGDTMIIPAAEVLSGMGFGIGGGGGSGPASTDDSTDDEDETMENTPAENQTSTTMGGSGVGGGGGGRIFSRPVAIIIASPDGVRVEPIVDVTKVALAMFTAIGFMISMMARMRRNTQED